MLKEKLEKEKQNRPDMNAEEIEAQLQVQEETKDGPGISRADQLTKLFGPT